jgi:putative membrane protein
MRRLSSKQITDGLGEVKAKLPEALSGIASLKDGTSELVGGIEEMKDKAAALPAGIKQLKDGADQLAAGTAELKKSVAALPDAIKQLKDGAGQVAAGDEQIDQIADQLAAIEKTINSDWENNIKPKIIADINDAPIPDFLKQELLTFVGDVDKIVEDIHDKITFDISEIDELAWGAAQVANGMGELDAQIPALISGIDQLASGAEQLANGMTQLNDQIPALLGGIDQLLDGAEKLDAGAGELKAGLEALPPGIDQLYTGSKTLTDGLYAGVELVPMLTNTQIDSISKVVASPVDITDTSKATASGYSEGLMPFFVALSAWVGAYALFIIVQPFSKRTLLAGMHPMKVAIGGWIFPTMVSMVQLGCVFFIVNVLLNMPSQNMLLSWLFFMLISCCYVSILFCLVAALEKVGLFIGLVLLILQLTSSGGTFPWQTTPIFFHYLHDLLPMGYAVDAIRRLFYGAALSPVILDAAVLVGYTCIFLVVGSIIVRKKRTFTIKGLTPAL